MTSSRPHAQSACAACLRRAWLLQALAGHLEAVRKEIHEVLALGDDELIAAVGGRRRRELERRLARHGAESALEAAQEANLHLICRCHESYPDRLRELIAPPAVLHIAGERERFLAAVADEPVAIVGTRRASGYGLESARSLGRGCSTAGVTVLSGMAAGIDAASHEGALSAGEPSVAVLPGSAEDPYPRSHRPLHRRLIRAGAAVSELPPGTPVRRWMFIARNRIIAALSAATVVVEATAGSGALVTAAVAEGLGRPVGAVPGRITAPQAEGTNALLADGAFVVRDAQDVLDAIYGIAVRSAAPERRPELTPDAREVLHAVASGADGAAHLAPGRTLAALAWLELAGYIRRTPGGRFAAVP